MAKALRSFYTDAISQDDRKGKEGAVPECLRQLKRLVDDTLAFFVVSKLGVTL